MGSRYIRFSHFLHIRSNEVQTTGSTHDSGVSDRFDTRAERVPDEYHALDEADTGSTGQSFGSHSMQTRVEGSGSTVGAVPSLLISRLLE